MHNGEKETNAVAYKTDLRETFNNARESDKVVKILNYRVKDSFLGRSSLSLGDRSSVEYSTKEIPFENIRSIAHGLNQVTPLSKLNEICLEQLINVIGYVSVEQAEISEIPTKYGLRKKVDAMITDDSCGCQVRFCIWESHIEYF